MNRPLAFLLTLVFLSGLIGLDWALANRPTKIQKFLDLQVEKILRVPHESNPPRLISPTELKIPDIKIYSGAAKDEEFLTCQSLVARVDPWKMLRGELEFEEIELVRPELHLRWGSDGALSLPSIFEPTETGGGAGAPRVIIHEMSVVFHDAPFWGADQVTILKIDLTMDPSFASRAYPYHLSGQIDDPTFGRFDIWADFGGPKLRGNILRSDFQLARQHTDYLPQPLRETLEQVKMGGGLELKVDFSAEDVVDQIDYTVTARFDDVDLQYDPWPFAISGMTGSLVLRDLTMTAENLVFRLAGADVNVKDLSVDFEGESPGFQVVAEVTKLQLDERVAADLQRLPEPFPDVGESLEAFGARGRIDVDVDLRKPNRLDARVNVDLLARFRQARLAYLGFEEADGTREGYPYPLEGIEGIVQIGNDGLEFRDLRSVVRSPDLIANGWVTYGKKALGYSVAIQGFGVHLDEKVRQTLPVAEREIYDSYDPSGPVDFDLLIKRTPGAEGPPELRLDVELKGCRVEPRLFPYPLSDMRGHLIFGEPGGTRIHDVTAQNGRARFEIQGLLDHRAAMDEPNYDLDIRVEDLAIDEDLLIGVSAEFPAIASEIRRFRFEGAVDFQCHISRRLGEDGTESVESNEFAADLKGLGFRHEEFEAAACSALFGRVRVKDDRLDIERAGFKLAGCDISASGWVDLGESAAHELFLECPNLVVNETTLAVAADAAPMVRELTELMDVQGAVTLGLKMRKGSQGQFARTSLTALGLTIELKEPALVFEDVHGSLTIEDDVVFQGWTAALPYGDGGDDEDRLIVNVNRGRWRETGGVRQLNVHEIGFRDLMLDERLFRRLPEDWSRTLRDWQLDGRVAGRITSLLLRDDDLSFKGELVPGELSFDPGVPIGLNHGRIVIEDAVIRPDGLDVKGSLEDADLTILQFPIVGARAVFQVDQRSVALRDLAGECLGGRVNPHETFFVMDHGIDGHFETSASLSEIDLSQWMKAFGGDPKQVSGRATTWGRMDGLVASQDTYRGQGEMWLSGRQLYDLPLMATVLRFLNLDFLANDELQTAHFEALIEEEKVKIRNARFDGPGLRLRGGGHIGFDGIAQLEFDPKIIKLLDPIPLIGDLVHLATGFVVSRIKITGPLEDLRAEGENYITEMLPGDEDSGRRMKPREVNAEKDR